MTTPTTDEPTRVARLREAGRLARELFDEIDARGVLAPGVSERAASAAIRDLARDALGVEQHWHKRVVRSGPNTLQPYNENPPDRVLTDDDIAYVDLGPVFAGWEADLGRTYVLGDDPARHALRDALVPVWEAGRAAFEADPEMTGERLYAVMTDLATDAGYGFGGSIAGHLVGEFPHGLAPGSKRQSQIAPGSRGAMRGTDSDGLVRHWILEVHLVDRELQIGGFYEDLLDLA